MFQRDDKVRLKRQATQEAIALAMQSRWEEAVVANKNIIESFPTDVDAYNRLGRALTELGRYAQARGAYQQALELDPYNTIAQKNISRLALLREEARTSAEGEPRRIIPQVFIEEKGRAGIVYLENPAPQEVLARMVAGNEVLLRVKGERVIVEDRHGEYLGQVEAHHAGRLAKLIEGGNKYAAALASLGQDGAKVAIKEVYQHPSQAGRLSFPIRETEPFRPYIRDSLLKYQLEEEEAEGFSIEEGEYTPSAEAASAQEPAAGDEEADEAEEEASPEEE